MMQSITAQAALCWVSLCWMSHFIYCNAECCYAECRNAGCRWAGYYYAECHSAECHGAPFINTVNTKGSLTQATKRVWFCGAISFKCLLFCEAALDSQKQNLLLNCIFVVFIACLTTILGLQITPSAPFWQNSNLKVGQIIEFVESIGAMFR